MPPPSRKGGVGYPTPPFREGGGIYDSNVNSPVFFDLYNTVATHSTT